MISNILLGYILPLISVILTIFIIVFLIKSREILKYQYFTNEDETSKQMKASTPQKKIIKNNNILLQLLLILSILITAGNISKNFISNKDVRVSKDLIKVLYTSNTKTFIDDFNRNFSNKIDFYNKYKLNPNNINNLRDRHFPITSSKTTIEFLSETRDSKQGKVTLEYRLISPNLDYPITRLAIIELKGNKIVDFDEFNITPVVNYSLEKGKWRRKNNEEFI